MALGTNDWERSAAAGRLGLQRIMDDPGGFAGLVVRKFRVQWADDSYGATYALSLPSVAERTQAIFGLLSQLFYVALTAVAAIAVVQARNSRPSGHFLLVVLITGVAAAHVLIEVQARYHAYLIPVLIGLAAPLVALWTRRTGDMPDAR